VTDPGYPNNTFKQGVLNTLYGGEARNKWGGKAWTFLNGWVRDIADWLLTWKRQPYQHCVLLVQDSLSPGDVIVWDFGLTATDPLTSQKTHYLRKASSGTGAANAIVVAIALESIGAGSQVNACMGGLLPAALFNLAGQPGGSLISVNYATGTLKAWASGDEAIGYVDALGNILFLGAARAP
jgi:hypothetical protein